jgi:hypothetical protein
MKRPVKGKAKRDPSRDLFAELSEGLEAFAEARHGDPTLRTHAVEHMNRHDDNAAGTNPRTQRPEDLAHPLRHLSANQRP